MAKLAQQARSGAYYVGNIEKVITSRPFQQFAGTVQLILTSPPFPLNEKKSYGNLQGDEYLRWLSDLGPSLERLLKPNGSVVIEVGNSWEPGRPVQSLLPLQALMELTNRSASGGLRLIQQFVCYNPSRLPSPAQWVTVNRLRAVDSYTHVWWLALSDYPKADNSKVLRPYSAAMNALHRRGSFNAGKRPSQHKINEAAFLKNCGGSIAHNFLEVDALDSGREVRLPALPSAFSFSNTASNDYFTRQCKDRGLEPHPARMPLGLAAFFIAFLTEPADLVLDPFAGSNTTGYAAAMLGRKWLAVDAEPTYVEQSRLRFTDPELKQRRETHSRGNCTENCEG
jgi:site-specific DNA-methyltransferase (cytosine-N4-specific)